MSKILIVDDDSMIVELLTDLIKIKFPGVEVDGVTSGKDAIEKLKEERYNLLITDILIPDMSGYEIALFMQKNKINTPILFMTGANLDQISGNLTFNNDFDFIEKPFFMPVLMDKIERYVRAN